MKFLYSLLLCYTAFSIQVWHVKSACEHLVGYSGVISHESLRRDEELNMCWQIDPPEDRIVHINFVEFNLDNNYCKNAHVELSDSYGKREMFCQGDNYPDKTNQTVIFMGAVNVTLFMGYSWAPVTILWEYNTESLTCAYKDHFRCSSRECVFPKQVCDGIKDCENALDESECGVLTIKGANISRINAINRLKSLHTEFGWGRNTPRAVTSLYLVDTFKLRGKNVDEETIIKELQLKIAASILRNSTDPMSVNELSMYVNSLLVTCHNVRNIFSEDLLKILADRAFSTSPISPGAYLTLCNANWPFSKRNIDQLSNLLTKEIEYPFALEIRAMALMSLSCLNQKTSSINSTYNVSSIFDKSIRNFIKNQKQDGSFGNAHTTALVTQALMSSGKIKHFELNVRKAVQFLMKSLNSSSVDFLTIYLTLPLLKGKTLLDIGNVDCSGYKRKLEEDDDILDMVDKSSAKIHVQYSLYIGNSKNVIHNIYLKVPENSTVYDVMKIAQIADPKYKFSPHQEKGHVYIYGIAGLTNDMEAGMFWMSHLASKNNTELQLFTQSPDQVIMTDQEHLIMWYKSVHI